MDADATGRFRDLIAKRLAELEAEDTAASGARDTVMLDQQSVGRLSRMDAMQQQAMAQATHARRVRERTALQAALKRMADGEYGYCEDCGDDIERRRLELSPQIRLCVSCARG